MSDRRTTPNVLTDVQRQNAEAFATKAREHESKLLVASAQNPRVAQRIASELLEGDFADSENRAVFSALRACIQRSQRKVSELAMRDELTRAGDLELLTPGYLADVFDVLNADMTSQAPYLLERVLDASRRRQLLAVARSIAASAIDLNDADPVSTASGLLLSGITQRGESTVKHISDVLHGKALAIQAAHEASQANKSPVADSGFTELDDEVVFGPGKLVVIGARPGMGKTSFAWGTAVSIAKDRPVLLRTLEMDAGELAGRQISIDLGISAHSQAHGDIREERWPDIYGLADEYRHLKLFIDDGPKATVDNIQYEAQALALRLKEPIGAVFIDYLGLLDAQPGGGKFDNQATVISRITRAAKQMAGALKCPVFLLAQLSREVEKETRKNKRPQLSDLRDSGSIEQDASIVMFLYRDEYYNPDSPAKGLAEVIVAKNRDGKTTTVKLHWDAAKTSFKNIPQQVAMAFSPNRGPGIFPEESEF